MKVREAWQRCGRLHRKRSQGTLGALVSGIAASQAAGALGSGRSLREALAALCHSWRASFRDPRRQSRRPHPASECRKDQTGQLCLLRGREQVRQRLPARRVAGSPVVRKYAKPCALPWTENARKGLWFAERVSIGCWPG